MVEFRKIWLGEPPDGIFSVASQQAKMSCMLTNFQKKKIPKNKSTQTIKLTGCTFQKRHNLSQHSVSFFSAHEIQKNLFKTCSFVMFIRLEKRIYFRTL